MYLFEFIESSSTKDGGANDSFYDHQFYWFSIFPLCYFFTISLPLQVTAYVLVISYICHVKDLFVANLYKVPTLYYLI